MDLAQAAARLGLRSFVSSLVCAALSFGALAGTASAQSAVVRSVAGPTRHGQAKDADGSVLDFCLNPPQSAPGVWLRQRLVIFDIGGEEVSGQAESEVDAKGNVIGE